MYRQGAGTARGLSCPQARLEPRLQVKESPNDDPHSESMLGVDLTRKSGFGAFVSHFLSDIPLAEQRRTLGIRHILAENPQIQYERADKMSLTNSSPSPSVEVASHREVCEHRDRPKRS
jgi:hypothetical protein